MRPLRIVGPSDAGKTTLIERLVPKLAERGRVATIKHLDCRVEIDEPGKDTYRHRAAGAAETYGVMPDGSWFATGGDRSLGPLLLDLVPEYDAVLVEGYSTDGRIPAVVLGDRGYAGAVVATAADVDALEVDDVLEGLERTEGIETLETLSSAIRRSVGASGPVAVGTCSARLGPGGPADRSQRRLGSAIDTCRAAAADGDGVAAVETHCRPALCGEADAIGFVAVGARTQTDAADAVTACRARILEALPDASVELAARWRG